MWVTPSRLRIDIHNTLDSVARTGAPVEVVRGGELLRIVPARPASKLARLKRHDCLTCPPDELIQRDWIK